MRVTALRLQQLAPHIPPSQALPLAMALETAMPLFGVESVLEVAHFMGQACHETQGFTRFVENLHYTDPERLDDMFLLIRGIADAAQLIEKGPEAIANRVYARRNGNFSEQSGDGWRFRGRGAFQLTGRDSYARASVDLDRPYVAQPDLVAQPEGAVLTALWFWRQNHCGFAAGRDDVAGVTRIINGPRMAGLEERRALTERAKAIFA
jgi:putative chitinase